MTVKYTITHIGGILFLVKGDESEALAGVVDVDNLAELVKLGLK